MMMMMIKKDDFEETPRIQRAKRTWKDARKAIIPWTIARPTFTPNKRRGKQWASPSSDMVPGCCLVLSLATWNNVSVLVVNPRKGRQKRVEEGVFQFHGKFEIYVCVCSCQWDWGIHSNNTKQHITTSVLICLVGFVEGLNKRKLWLKKWNYNFIYYYIIMDTH